MSSKHTKSELTAVFEAIKSLGGQDALAPVLKHPELCRMADQHLMQSEVEQLAGPRYGHSTTSSPQVYRDLQAMSTPPEHVIRALYLGLGTRRYREVAETLMDSFGLSKSRLSEIFVEHSREILEAFLERRLDDATYVALYVDGKIIQGQSMICVSRALLGTTFFHHPRLWII